MLEYNKYWNMWWQTVQVGTTNMDNCYSIALHICKKATVGT